jgi:hypothetical protein
MKDWIFDRLKENSTWRGLILLAGLLGAHFKPEEQEAIIGAALALVALINIFRTGTKPGGEFNPRAEVRKAKRA